MIQSTLNTPPAKETEWSYPCLGKGQSGQVILFSGYGIGMVVVACDSVEVGEHSQYWDMPKFTPLSPEESVTLRNAAK